MTYRELERLTSGKEFPILATNELGEPVIIEIGENENGKFYRTQTAQENDWLRTNVFWEDGSVDELYEK